MIRSLWSYPNRVDGFMEAAFLIADGEIGLFLVHSQPASEQADGRPSLKVGLVFWQLQIDGGRSIIGR